MEGTCEQDHPRVGEEAWGCSLSWNRAFVPLGLRAVSPGLCPDAVTPHGTQEVGKPLPQGTICPIGAVLACALEVIREAGCPHRDMGPGTKD